MSARFPDPPHRIRRFGEPTHTMTHVHAAAPCGEGQRVLVPNDAYERPVEVECLGHESVDVAEPVLRHRFAIVVHEDAQGVPVVFFAQL